MRQATVGLKSPPIRRTEPTRTQRDLAAQLSLSALGALLYFGVRGLTEADPFVAIEHGESLLRFERTLGLDVESRLQNMVIQNRWLVTAVNWIYIWGHWPVLVATLLWLHRVSRSEFLRLRNAMFISGAIGLIIFASYPVAPPRLLGGPLLDTVSQYSSSYRVLQPPSLVNKYAALPSLHVGWNLLVGIFVSRNAATQVARAVGAVSPLFMTAAVVLTANHFVVDTFLGAGVALLGLMAANVANKASLNKARNS